MKLKRLLSGVATRQVEGGWARWCGAVRRANEERQKADRRLWYLHAKANQNNDLLAWYHATFCREVYRRRGTEVRRGSLGPFFFFRGFHPFPVCLLKRFGSGCTVRFMVRVMVRDTGSLFTLRPTHSFTELLCVGGPLAG